MAILGIDEVGRGPLAGPLVVGAVVLPENARELEWYDELKDSKKISAKKRGAMADAIRDVSTVGLGWVAAEELDTMGIIAGLRLATRRAVAQVKDQHAHFSEIIIDGNINFLADTRLGEYTTTLIKGDNLIKEISAASIVAKIARDNYMVELSEKYPVYGFERHMGYGTELHRRMLVEHGVCPEHRRFLKIVHEIAERDGEDLDWVWSREEGTRKNTTQIGVRGEAAACRYLEAAGHRIVARNYKTKLCEIDIVSTRAGKIYFTEVKYRRSDFAGGGLAAITREKLRQMKFAAECFLKMRPEYKDYDPLLAVAEVMGDEFVVKDWFPVV